MLIGVIIELLRQEKRPKPNIKQSQKQAMTITILKEKQLPNGKVELCKNGFTGFWHTQFYNLDGQLDIYSHQVFGTLAEAESWFKWAY